MEIDIKKKLIELPLTKLKYYISTIPRALIGLRKAMDWYMYPVRMRRSNRWAWGSDRAVGREVSLRKDTRLLSGVPCFS